MTATLKKACFGAIGFFLGIATASAELPYETIKRVPVDIEFNEISELVQSMRKTRIVANSVLIDPNCQDAFDAGFVCEKFESFVDAIEVRITIWAPSLINTRAADKRLVFYLDPQSFPPGVVDGIPAVPTKAWPWEDKMIANRAYAQNVLKLEIVDYEEEVTLFGPSRSCEFEHLQTLDCKSEEKAVGVELQKRKALLVSSR